MKYLNKWFTLQTGDIKELYIKNNLVKLYFLYLIILDL